MSTALLEKPATPAKPHSQSNGEEHFVIHGVSYQAYVTISDALPDHPIRFNYDRGRLELMTISLEHEWTKKLFSSFIESIRVETRTKVISAGSLTCRKEDLERGFEPDESYWIQNAARMRGKLRYDPETDPPPDLMIEIEISRSIVDRIGICAALRVPEVWCSDGKYLKVLLLQPDGKYQESSQSKAFPFLPIAKVAEFLAQRNGMDETDVVLAFRDWVRAQVAAGWPPDAPGPAVT